MIQPLPDPIHLRAGGASVVLTTDGERLPAVLHWGADLGDLTAADLAELARAGVPAPVPNDLDRPTRAGILAEHADGWNGRPGLAGQRAGRAWSPLFALTDLAVADDPDGGARVRASGRDAEAGLELHLELQLLASGALRQRATVARPPDAVPEPFVVDGLALALPVPPVATELFDLAGRWGRERAPQRMPFVVGVHSRENRRGRTGPDAPLILAAGTEGFGYASGEVWAIHVAWSGNHVAYAERLSTGAAVLGGGELLLPGEVLLRPGESYTGPWVYAAHATGLDGIAARFHTMLRARPHHP